MMGKDLSSVTNKAKYITRGSSCFGFYLGSPMLATVESETWTQYNILGLSNTKIQAQEIPSYATLDTLHSKYGIPTPLAPVLSKRTIPTGYVPF
jgi:hypothetical protein